MNSELKNSKVSLIGISNDLKFVDYLDSRVQSSLGRLKKAIEKKSQTLEQWFS